MINCNTFEAQKCLRDKHIGVPVKFSDFVPRRLNLPFQKPINVCETWRMFS